MPFSCEFSLPADPKLLFALVSVVFRLYIKIWSSTIFLSVSSSMTFLSSLNTSSKVLGKNGLFLDTGLANKASNFSSRELVNCSSTLLQYVFLLEIRIGLQNTVSVLFSRVTLLTSHLHRCLTRCTPKFWSVRSS